MTTLQPRDEATTVTRTVKVEGANNARVTRRAMGLPRLEHDDISRSGVTLTIEEYYTREAAGEGSTE